MQNLRKAISAGELYVILDREFRRRQSPRCGSCYILLPYRVDQGADERSNWEIIMPPDCAYGCARIVEALVDEYSMLYDLKEASGEDD